IAGMMIPAYAYYSSNVAPFLPGGSQYQKPDPFTLEWNGSIVSNNVAPQLFAHLEGSLTNTGSFQTLGSILGVQSGDLLVGNFFIASLTCGDGHEFKDSLNGDFGSAAICNAINGSPNYVGGTFYIRNMTSTGSGTDTF